MYPRRLLVLLLLLPLLLKGNAGTFVQNKGQWEKHILFKYEFSGGAVFLEADRLTYVLADLRAIAQHHEHSYLQTKGSKEQPDSIAHYAYQVFFEGAQTPTAVYGTRAQNAYRNYFLGADPTKWHGNVGTFLEVVYKNVYPNIDLRLYVHPEEGFKYDFIVATASHHKKIALRYEGLQRLFTSAGHLVLETSLGQVFERPPVSWQSVGSDKLPVATHYQLEGNVLRFHIQQALRKLPLIIDPSVVFSSYTGSLADNFGFTATYDAQGNLYAGGTAYATGYPTSTGAYQLAHAGLVDVAISKFAADGKTLHYSTYLGGSLYDQPHSMIVSTTGELVVMGTTGSANFPVTTGAFQGVFNGGPAVTTPVGTYTLGADLYLTRFNATGTQLVGSTFLGGTMNDGLNILHTFHYADENRGEVLLDSAGNIFVASASQSLNFPTTPGTFQPTATAGQHGVLVKMNASLTQMIWGTFLSGTCNEGLNAAKLNQNQSLIYTTGATCSTLPTTIGAYRTQPLGGKDALIAAFNTATGQLTHLTYTGTAADDIGYFIEVDAAGKVYLFGQSKGAMPILNAGFSNANSSQFLQQFDANLNTLERSTVFGKGNLGVTDLAPTALMVDRCNNLYLSGWGGQVNVSGSLTGFPTTPNAIQTTTDGSDFYFMVLSANWSLQYATFFGGTSFEHVDGGTSRFSPDGTIYQAICAGCGRQGYPTMPNDVWSTTNNSANCNLAALKIAFQLGEVQLDADVQPRSGCAPLTLQFVNNSRNAHLVTWDFDDGSGPDTRFLPTKTYTQPGNYTIRLVVTDTLCQTTDSAFFEIVVRTPDSTGIDFSVVQDPCDVSQPVQFTYLGFPTDSIVWDFGDGQIATAQHPSHTYRSTGTYNVVLTVYDSICNGLVTFSRTLTFEAQEPFQGIQWQFDYCANPWNIKLAAPYLGFQTVQWDLGDGTQLEGRDIDYRFTTAGTYTITLVITDTVCNRTHTETFTLDVGDYGLENFLPNVFTPNGDGINDYWQLANPAALVRYPGFKLKLYNRWGSLVFETDQPQFRWPGTQAGNGLAEGVFFWVAELTDVCGNPFERKGTLTLSR